MIAVWDKLDGLCFREVWLLGSHAGILAKEWDRAMDLGANETHLLGKVCRHSSLRISRDDNSFSLWKKRWERTGALWSYWLLGKH